MGQPKTSDDTAVIPQPHGGALRRGDKPGNKGGRPPSAVREACRLAFHQRLKVLKDIADGKIDASPADRIKAVDTLGKYGGIQKIEHTGADDGPIQVNVVELRERIASRLARLAATN